jgi:hypothetical protein
MSPKDQWEKEKAAVAAVQIAFDLGVDTQIRIKKLALDERMNAPEFIRKILGLEFKARPVRPRLTLSLSDEDLGKLANAWGLDPSNRLKIKETAAKKLVEYVRSTNK